MLGIATDVAVAAAANRPDSSSAWTSFGIAIRTLGGAGGLGVLTAGPLSGWVAGPGAAERLTELIDPLVEELGSRAPSPDYLGTVAWSLDQLDLVRGAEPPVAAPSTEAGLAGLLGGIDPGLITSVLGALAPADGVGPPLAVDEALDETERLVGEITRLGASQSSDRSRALHDSAAESRNTATLLLLMAAAVVGAAVILLLLLVVAALSSDKDNLYLTVSARQANPGVRIVARCAELSHVDKIKKSGADAVVSPNFIGGMRLVSELLRPAVVRFLDDMLRDRRATFRIEEIQLGERAGELGATLREARVRERFGMTVLAVRARDQQSWVYNPDAGERLGPGMTLVVLGSAEQVAELRRVAG